VIQSSALVTQIANNGAARVLGGESPDLKRPANLSKLHGEQNLDFFEESFRDVQSRDNSDGDVSIHVFSSGPDQDPDAGKIKVGNLEAEITGDTQNGTRFSVETRENYQKIKAHRFEEDKVVVYEATVKPNNEMNSSVLILDRENPEQSLIGSASSDWLLS
jgi:hypothetical protein